MSGALPEYIERISKRKKREKQKKKSWRDNGTSNKFCEQSVLDNGEEDGS